MGVINGDTRSLDYRSTEDLAVKLCWAEVLQDGTWRLWRLQGAAAAKAEVPHKHWFKLVPTGTAGLQGRSPQKIPLGSKDPNDKA